MKKSWLLGVLMLLAVLPVGAQQVMYSNLKELVENRGDTVTPHINQSRFLFY